MFSKWINFEISHCTKFHCSLNKTSLDYQTVIHQRLSLSVSIQLDFSWTLEMLSCQDDRFARSSGSLRSSLTFMCTNWELFHRKSFIKKINSKLGNQKKFHCVLSKISLFYEAAQKLTFFHELFSWTSVGPPKYLINK